VPIKFVMTAEMRAENTRKMVATRRGMLERRYGGLLARYREGGMHTLSTVEAGKLLGVSGSTVRRMLTWANNGN